jgi:hypothetical protein
MNLEFSRQIFEKDQTSSFLKICPVGAKLSHVGEQTDGHEANGRFSQFCERA